MSRESYPTVPDRVGATGVAPFGGSKEGNAISMIVAFLEDHVIPVLRGTTQGKTNNVGDVTLTASSTTTTLTDANLTPNSHIAFTPTTASAVLATAALYVSARDNETATLTHDSTPDIDRTFTYCITG